MIDNIYGNQFSLQQINQQLFMGCLQTKSKTQHEVPKPININVNLNLVIEQSTLGNLKADNLKEIHQVQKNVNKQGNQQLFIQNEDQYPSMIMMSKKQKNGVNNQQFIQSQDQQPSIIISKKQKNLVNNQQIFIQNQDQFPSMILSKKQKNIVNKNQKKYITFDNGDKDLSTIKFSKKNKSPIIHKQINQQPLNKNQNVSIEEIKSQIIRSFHKQDVFLLNSLEVIMKKLLILPIYIWVDQRIYQGQNIEILNLLKAKDINPILCKTVEEVKDTLNNSQTDNQNFRIISSARLGEDICKQFQANKKVVHIYIFCANKQAGEALKSKWKKIKFYTVNVNEFLIKIEQQSKYDNKFAKLANFMEITNKNNSYDSTIINNSRYNLYGLFLFKNRALAKDDFIKLAKYIYSSKYSINNIFSKQIKDFQDQYPVEYNHPKTLNWYTKQTFFYGLLNNFLRSSSNPLQTPYIRLPFEATFKAIKSMYDQGKQQKSLTVYRGGTIDQNQLQYLQKNVGQYIQMFGFMSTSLKKDIAKRFIKINNGNSLIEVIIQNQDRQQEIDYGYINLSKYTEYQGEEQVLFNALNVFKINSYTKEDGLHKITLKYGQLARIVKRGQEKVTQKEKNIIFNYKHQQKIIKNYIKDQGDVFKYCQMYDDQIEYRKANIIRNQQNIQNAHQMHKIGLTYNHKGQYDKSLQYYQKSLEIKVSILGQNHNSVADTMNNIGIVYGNKNQYDNALKYYQKSLNIKKNQKQYDSSIADILNNIGLLYNKKNEFKKALLYFQRSLQIKMKNLGQYHSSTADTLHNIGSIYNCVPEYNKALQYYQKSLKIYLNILGQSHSSTADTFHNIGSIYDIKGEYDRALQYYSKSLKVYQSILGQKNSNTADILNCIGLVYFHKSDYDTALKHYQRSLKIYKQIYGQNHQSIVDTLYHIGSIYDSKGEYTKALSYYQQSLRIQKNTVGENHIITAEILNNIGLLYYNKSEQDKALQYFQGSLKIKEKILGQYNSSTAETIQNIGSVYQNKKNYIAALQYYERSLKIKMTIFGQNHNSTADTLSNIGLAYYNQNKITTAQSYYKKCQKIRAQNKSRTQN